MSNNLSVSLIFLLLVGWIGFSTYHYANCLWPYCGGGSVTTSTELGVPFSISDESIKISQSERSPQFTFGKSSAIFPEATTAAFEDLKKYLDENPNKKVIITGQSTRQESPKGTLGFKRAKAVQAHLLDLGFAERQTDTGSQILKSLDFVDNTVEGATRFEVVDIPASSHSLQVKDGDELLMESPNNFIFPISDYKYNTPLDDSLNNGLDAIVTFLKENPSKGLAITGKYLEEEKNNSVFSNLGEARALSVKNYLIEKGIPVDAISQSSKIDNFSLRDDTDILHAIDLSIVDRSVEVASEDLGAMKKKLQQNALKLYFGSNKQSLNLDASQRAYIGDALSYLDKDAKAKIYLTGHTDNQGKEKVNIRLSRKRAEFVRDYFAKNGIPKNKIVVRFKGPNEPIAPNGTEDGRAKNRRVEVTVK